MNPNGDRYYLELHQLLVPAPFDRRVLAGTGPRRRACRRSRVDRADGRFCECYISGGQSVQGPQQARHKRWWSEGGLEEWLVHDALRRIHPFEDHGWNEGFDGTGGLGGFREDGGRERGTGGDDPREVLIRVRECKSCCTLETTVLV